MYKIRQCVRACVRAVGTDGGRGVDESGDQAGVLYKEKRRRPVWAQVEWGGVAEHFVVRRHPGPLPSYSPLLPLIPPIIYCAELLCDTSGGE